MIARIAGGAQGFLDGKCDVAKFNLPRAAAYNDGFLYVTDTGNFAIRKIDLNGNLIKFVIITNSKLFGQN